MALTQIDFDDKEEQIISQCSKTWKTNKPKTVKRIISNFKLNIITTEKEVKKNE